MAKYTVTHLCGHNHVHQIFGSNSKGQRDHKLEWLARQDCPACAQAKRDAENAETNAAAAAANAEAGLPELTGTPKQIAWAESIRAAKIPEMDKPINEVADLLAAGKAVKNGVERIMTDAERAFGEKLLAAAQEFRNATNAAWWIENRDRVFDSCWMLDLGKEIKKNMLQNKEAS